MADSSAHSSSPLARAILRAGVLLVAVGVIASFGPASAGVRAGGSQSGSLDDAEALSVRVAELHGQGRYAEAIPFAERAVAIRERLLGPNDPATALSLTNLAELYRNLGQYAKAEPLYVRVLTTAEKAAGPNHPATALSLNNLALLYYNQGQYAKAEPLYVRALAINEKALGPEHPSTALSLNNLAELYRSQGQYVKAEPLYMRALAINEKALGSEHSSTARSLNNLGLLYFSQGQYAKAELLFVRALAIYEKALGLEHPDTALAVNNLAFLYFNQGQYAKSEPLFVRALAVNEKMLGPEHPSTALSLNNLALLYYYEGQYSKAEPLYVRALAVREKALGPEHPDTAFSLSNLAALYAAQGDYQRAILMQARANEVRERDLLRNLGAGSEREKFLYLRLSAPEVDETLSLHAQRAPYDPNARRLALEILLRRKGRVLDATLDSVEALRRRASSADLALLDQLAAARADLSRRTLAGPGTVGVDRHRADLASLEERVEQLESRISARSAEFRAASQPVSLDAVQRLVPDGAVLVEFASYFPYDAKTRTWGERRYSVYTLGREGEPGWADLGEAKRIDAAVAILRDVVRSRTIPEWLVRAHARALDERLMRPVRALAGPARWLMLAPDGPLNLVPFAALVDERDNYLVERYTISYLTSGRDLLRLAVERPTASPPVLIADPDFDMQPTPTPTHGFTRGGDSADLSTAFFTPLPGTAEEAKAIAPLLAGVRVLTRRQASEPEIKRVRAPLVLHVATHGYFLDDTPSVRPAAGADAGRLLQHDLPSTTPDLAPTDRRSGDRAEHPLLRAGLGLAGANSRRGGEGEDGILTGLEVAGLNLWGTKMVVLSACDTGVGEPTTGEGVFGLRRALVLAGSETQVMSLWPVSDAGTRDLMIAYYRALAAGRGRTEALRDVQLEMLRDPNRRHPYYWASFIQSGAWGPLWSRTQTTPRPL